MPAAVATGAATPRPPSRNPHAEHECRGQPRGRKEKRRAQVGQGAGRQVEGAGHRRLIEVRAVRLEIGRDVGRWRAPSSRRNIATAPHRPQPGSRARAYSRRGVARQLLGAREPEPQEHGHRRPRAEAVVLHPRTALDDEEADDHGRPRRRGGAAPAPPGSPRIARTGAAETSRNEDGEDAPRKEPDRVLEEPEPQRDRAVVVGLPRSQRPERCAR